MTMVSATGPNTATAMTIEIVGREIKHLSLLRLLTECPGTGNMMTMRIEAGDIARDIPQMKAGTSVPDIMSTETPPEIVMIARKNLAIKQMLPWIQMRSIAAASSKNLSEVVKNHVIMTPATLNEKSVDDA
jgi:hypothetical protein